MIGVHSAKFPAEQITANLREAVQRHGIAHPVVNDARHGVWRSYAIRAWPTVLLVDPLGRIVQSRAGEIMAEELVGPIEALIAEHAAAGTLRRGPLAAPGDDGTGVEASTLPRTGARALGDPDAVPTSALQASPQGPLRYPAKLHAALVDGEPRLYVADTGHHRILELALDADGLGARLLRAFGSGEAGLADGPAVEARFHGPHGLDLQAGTLYVADTENHALRAVDLVTGEVRTLAGTGEKAHGRFILGAPTETPLRSPWAVLAVERLLFVAMAGSHQIWVLIEERELGPFAGSGREALIDGPRAQAGFNQPSDLALGMSHLFVADAEASAVRAIRLDEDPEVFTLVGTGLFDFGDRDGVAGEVLLQHPAGLAFGGGHIYIADSYNHKLKRLDPTTARVTTLAGSGEPGHADGPFAEARLFEPEGIAVLGERLYVADTNNHAIRVADLGAERLETLRIRDAMPPSRA